MMMLVIAGLVVAAPPSAVAEPAAIAFLETGPLRMPRGGTARATLFNSTAVPYDLTFTTVATDGTGASVATVRPAVLRLDAGGIGVVTIDATGPAGSSGLLVAIARTTGGQPAAVASRPVAIVAPTAAWAPLVSTWQVTSYRGVFLRGPRNAALPLANGVTCPASDMSAPVGSVAVTGGAASVVTATCRAGQRQVDLAFAGGLAAGDYTGTIDLTPDDEKTGTVALTLRRTDDPTLPLLLLLAGIALAIAATLQIGRLSSVSLAVEESWLLQADAATAHQQVHRAAGGAPWRDYSFMQPVTTRLDTVRERLTRLRYGFGDLDAGKGPYKEQLDTLTAIRKVIDAWPAIAPRLIALAAARHAVETAPGDRPGEDAADLSGAASHRTVPVLVEHAARLLIGGPLEDLDAVLPLITDVDATTTALQAWPADAAAVHELRELSRRLRPATERSGSESDRRVLLEADTVIDSVLERMWAAADGTGYAAIRVGEQLALPAATLYRLRSRPRLLVPSGAAGADVSRPVPLPPVIPDGTLALVAARDGAAANAARVARSRRVRNALVLLAFAGVTVWTGLSALYFDRAFGTWRDCTAILMWGFGSQAGLTAIAAALDRIVAGGQVVRP